MSISLKEQCLALRARDKSITEIMKITGRSKSSIYFHIRNIPLSPKRLEEFHRVSAEHIRKFASARKGKSTKVFKTFEIWTSNTVLLIAHLLFDGELSDRGPVYNNRSFILVDTVEQRMKQLYAFEPARHTDMTTGVHRISYHNVALGSYMQKKAALLLRDIPNLKSPLKKTFLQAFFDDEGCMDFRPHQNKRSIRGYQKDVRILHIAQKLLSDIGIISHLEKPNEVVIVGKENLQKFQKEINFSAGVRINGNRTNSRWKRHLEKRELLRLAIASFKN